MKLDEFEIGREFWMCYGSGSDDTPDTFQLCICTDKGTRTICYQEIVPITLNFFDTETKSSTTQTFTVEEARSRGEYLPSAWDSHVDHLLNDYEFGMCYLERP